MGTSGTNDGFEKALMPAQLLIEDAIVAASVPVSSRRCGIYFLIKDDRVVYVGQSVHIDARLLAHAREKSFDRWHWIPCQVDALDEMERRYLDALRRSRPLARRPVNRLHHLARSSPLPAVPCSDSTSQIILLQILRGARGAAPLVRRAAAAQPGCSPDAPTGAKR